MLNLFCLHRLKNALLYVSDSSPVTVPHILKSAGLCMTKKSPAPFGAGLFFVSLLRAGAGLEGV